MSRLLNLTPNDTVLKMRIFRSIAVILILVLGSSPALAAICATSCASNSMMSSVHSAEMAGMQNCHEKQVKDTQHKPINEHKSCAMGSGCHVSQITPIQSPTKDFFVAITAIAFPSFKPSEKSVELSPPLKPPA